MPSKLTSRKSKAEFETPDTVFSKGQHRPIIVCLEGKLMHLRLKGTRNVFSVHFAAVYDLALKQTISMKG